MLPISKQIFCCLAVWSTAARATSDGDIATATYATLCPVNDGLDADVGDIATSCRAPSLLQRGKSSVQVLQPRPRQPMLTAEGEAEKFANCSETLWWFHCPKCGSSFRRTLSSLSPDENCWGNTVPGMVADHSTLSQQDYKQWNGSIYGMFREPSSRAYSSYVFFNYDCWENGDCAPPRPAYFPITPNEYKKHIQGLVTKMLAGQGEGGACSLDWHLEGCGAANKEPDVETALARLDGFAFVGLQEQWDLSICLFYKMFGGQCRLETNGHLTNYSANVTEADFGSFEDPADEAIYEKAAAIFWSNVEKYEVSTESCERDCITVGA